MELHDIVYVLKDDPPSEELRYSLRSVCKNFPYRKIWFFGGKPDGINPDEYVPMKQKGVEVYERSTSSIIQACKTPDVTDDFWLFNDDFFVMKPVEDLPPIFDRTLQKRIEQIRTNNGGGTSLYSIRLEQTKALLEADGKKTFNYAVHIPMLINKKKALEVFSHYPRSRMFRSLYGNYWNIGGRQMKDVKVNKKDDIPSKTSPFLSTNGVSFNGETGAYIRKMFLDKCRYED